MNMHPTMSASKKVSKHRGNRFLDSGDLQGKIALVDWVSRSIHTGELGTVD